ncbi:MAG: hypothetical protein WA239_23115, partial [Candidatus Sulfotelmatobacter sp.]
KGPRLVQRKLFSSAETSLPKIHEIANPVIMSALGVSVTYAVAIHAGRRRPHPRHWEALAELVGIAAESPRDPQGRRERPLMASL